MVIQILNETRIINDVPKVKEVYSWLPFSLPIERTFDPVRGLGWFKENWHTSIYWCALYLVAIYVGQKLMSHREQPFKLRRPLFLWNLALAAFSIMGTLRFLEESVYLHKNFGFRFGICDISGITQSGTVGFWCWMFAMSKLVEFGDTAFIVLRKQKLILLHWYHHVTVCIYSWFTMAYLFAPARWFGAMNFAVHSVMYSYYALKAARVRVPRLVAMSITLLQIIQMVFGTLINLYAYMNLGNNCPHVQRPPIYLGLAIYGSYMALFCHFFVNAYLQGFAKATLVKTDKSSIRVDENANIIEAKKKIK